MHFQASCSLFSSFYASPVPRFRSRLFTSSSFGAFFRPRWQNHIVPSRQRLTIDCILARVRVAIGSALLMSLLCRRCCLCLSEDYNWWWRSFLCSATSGVYVMLYAIYYFHSRLSLSHTTGSLVYFGYSFIMAYACFILTGKGLHATLSLMLLCLALGNFE